MTTQQVIELVERLDRDNDFTSALEGDPIATLRSEGFDELVAATERDRDRIGELVDRIYRDDEFRTRVEHDPTGELIGWGLPEFAIEPVLLLAGAPDDVIERATADVEAHLSAKSPVTVAAVAAVLGTLAFAQQATASIQSAQATPQATAQVSPQLTAQVSPQLTAQVRPQTKAQVSAQASSQVAPQAKAQWHGIQAQSASALASFLRTHTMGL
ncbi:MAG: hypothetical protein ACRDNY_07060 [Gaiellaceae bacterium]